MWKKGRLLPINQGRFTLPDIVSETEKKATPIHLMDLMSWNVDQACIAHTLETEMSAL